MTTPNYGHFSLLEIKKKNVIAGPCPKNDRETLTREHAHPKDIRKGSL